MQMQILDTKHVTWEENCRHCVSEKIDLTEPNQEFKVTVADKSLYQILETGEPNDESAESDIKEKTHFKEPILVADNTPQESFTGECSYKNLGPDVEEQTDYEGSSDDFVLSSDWDSDSSLDSENQRKKKKIFPKLKSNRHRTAEETTEEQVELDNGEVSLNNEQNAVVPVNKRGRKVKRGRKKTKEGEQTRKRKRDTKNWEKNVRKRLKAQGREYFTLKGKRNLEKKVKEACNCRRKCFE